MQELVHQRSLAPKQHFARLGHVDDCIIKPIEIPRAVAIARIAAVERMTLVVIVGGHDGAVGGSMVAVIELPEGEVQVVRHYPPQAVTVGVAINRHVGPNVVVLLRDSRHGDVVDDLGHVKIVEQPLAELGDRVRRRYGGGHRVIVGPGGIPGACFFSHTPIVRSRKLPDHTVHRIVWIKAQPFKQ